MSMPTKVPQASPMAASGQVAQVSTSIRVVGRSQWRVQAG
jgi:hypothetical protein